MDKQKVTGEDDLQHRFDDAVSPESMIENAIALGIKEVRDGEPSQALADVQIIIEQTFIHIVLKETMKPSLKNRSVLIWDEKMASLVLGVTHKALRTKINKMIEDGNLQRPDQNGQQQLADFH